MKKITTILETLKDLRLPYILVCILLMGGIINYSIEGVVLPPTMVYAKSFRVQSFIETIIYLFISITGVSGIFLLYKASLQRNKRLTSLYFVIGMVLFILASILPYWMWLIKLR
ncbi:hypothetical protein DRN86_04645 [Candidatus Geothermarchaeota archaeon]|nr:MAG: hypothetical protein DRN86_04645 [Candidatus Geothermarchaeota archaeon]